MYLFDKMDDDDEYEGKFVSEINCISHVEIKEEVIIPENSSDSESTLSDNEKNSDIKLQECIICCKYRSMFIILKNHDCQLAEEDGKCSFCSEISHWSACFKDHKESHQVESDPSSDSTTSDREDNDRECKVCLKYEFMVPLLKSHICKTDLDKKCQDCSEVLHWIECYKEHAESHEIKIGVKKIKEENSSDSTTSDNEEIQRLLAQVGKGERGKCRVCLKYQVMLIILEENHTCDVEKNDEKCEECDEILQWYKCYEKHKTSHSKTEVHPTEKETKTINNFGGKFDCGICLKLNSIVTNLVKNHTCIDNKSCTVCEEMSYWLSCLKNHKRSEMSSEDNRPSDSEELETLKNSPKQSNCGVCSKFRAAIVNLSDHTCRRKGKQKCEVCLELSFWARNYKNHENHHEKQSPLKHFLSCSSCGKRFSTEKMLNVHKSYCRSSQYTCELCDRQFVNMFSLKKHRIFQSCRSSSNSVQYKCKICKKVFSDSSGLKNHEEFHDDFKLFKCTKCPTEFKSELCLKKHKRIHR